MLQHLEAEHIRAYLQNENTVTINPGISNSIGGIQLMVHEAQVGRALELINELEPEYEHAIHCPVCGSSNVLFIPQPHNPANLLAAITAWIFGNYDAQIRKVYHCYNCSFEFEQLPG